VSWQDEFLFYIFLQPDKYLLIQMTAIVVLCYLCLCL